MNSIAKALGAGYTGQKILKYLSQHNPKLAQQISSALNAGHTIDHILNFLSRNEKKLGNLVSENKQTNRSDNLYKTAQKQIHPSLIGMAKAAGTAALGAASGYALSRALPHVGGLAQTAMQQNMLPGQSAPSPLSQGLPTSPTMPTSSMQNQALNPQTIQQSSQQPSANPSNIAQQAPQMQQPEGKNIDVGELLNKRGLLKHVEALAKEKRDPKEIAGILYSKYPNEMKDFQKEAGQPMENAISDFVVQQQNVPKNARNLGISPESVENNSEIQPISQIQEKNSPESQNQLMNDKLVEEFEPKTNQLKLGQRVQLNKGINKGKSGTISGLTDKIIEIKFDDGSIRSGPKDAISDQIEPVSEEEELEPEENPPKLEKKSIVSSPQGVGQVLELRNNKALVEVDGKKHVVNKEDLEQEPPDLEKATRHLMELIPENLKSTAIQTATYLPLPDNRSITLMKFWDGKIAWYLDVPEKTYDSIALGTYQPKGQAKTGIGEYKPGVFDSRGAGFSTEIRDNSLYSKANKGKTWGYAKNDYDAMSIIQPILKKMSKEEYDEEGNLIEPKKRKKRP